MRVFTVVTFLFSARFGGILFVFWYFIIYSLSAFCFFFFFCLFVCLFARFWWCFDCFVVLLFLSYKFLFCTFGYWLRYFHFSASCATTEAKSDEGEVLICYKKFRSHEDREAKSGSISMKDRSRSFSSERAFSPSRLLKCIIRSTNCNV